MAFSCKKTSFNDLQDKPFYVEQKLEDEEVLMERTVLSPASESMFGFEGFENREFVGPNVNFGSTYDNYVAFWNGEAYPFKLDEPSYVNGSGSGAMYIYGNAHILQDAMLSFGEDSFPLIGEPVKDSGEPFALLRFPTSDSLIYLFSAADTIDGVVFEIVKGTVSKNIKTLDSKFLPGMPSDAFVITLTNRDGDLYCDRTVSELQDYVARYVAAMNDESGETPWPESCICYKNGLPHLANVIYSAHYVDTTKHIIPMLGFAFQNYDIFSDPENGVTEIIEFMSWIKINPETGWVMRVDGSHLE